MRFLKVIILLLTSFFWKTQTLWAMDDLELWMRGTSLSQPSSSNIVRDGINSNRHTHTPLNGGNLYITDKAKISFPTKQGQKNLRIVPPFAKDLATSLNHALYFTHGLGGRSNHLFVSLGIAYKEEGQTKLSRKICPLTWSPITQEFAFSSPDPMDDSQYYVDFYNHAQESWVETAPYEIEGKKVKLVFHSSAGIPGVTPLNNTHSEPKSLGFLSSRKELIADALNKLPSHSKIKIIQLFLHSFLDFCESCEPMILHFQENFRHELLPYLQSNLSPHHFLFSKKGHNLDRTIFMVTGVNNRLYKMKSYFYNEGGKENTHTYAGYFLQSYQPYVGKVIWRQFPEQRSRLITYVNEPIGQGVEMTSPYGDLSLMMPLDQVTLYWRLRAHHLYRDLEEFKHFISPHLLMIDLKYARLGIQEDDDYGDDYTASQGNELIEAMQAIQPCQELRHLNLSGNWINSRINPARSPLPSLFSPFQRLLYLSLSDCSLASQEGAQIVSQILRFIPHLEHLDLSYNGINADIFMYLQPGLVGLSKPVTLNLSHNRLAHGIDFEVDYKGSAEVDTVEALEWIADYIHGTPSLLRVALTYNDFDGIAFSWSEVKDNAGLEREDLNKVREKLYIEEDAGLESSDSEISSSEENDEEETSNSETVSSEEEDDDDEVSDSETSPSERNSEEETSNSEAVSSEEDDEKESEDEAVLFE
ncbi:MAG: hypothetical protein MRY83_05200 [Flavobacteriales bacterium]|nr:hypothetical protein [Flavobacteriales bacterium]